jgi:mRNA deadenylase 3'-5' endonuclease subunit Ccr4
MDHRRQQVERVARAFYGAQEETLDWDRASEFVREEFRQYARDAIAFLEQRREQIPDAA